MTNQETQRKSKLKVVAFGALFLAVASMTATTSQALWTTSQDVDGSSIPVASMMGKVNNSMTTGEPSVALASAEGAKFWSAPLGQIPGEKIQESGVGKWTVNVTGINSNQPGLKTNVELGVHVDRGPWREASFTFAPCGQEPSAFPHKPNPDDNYSVLADYNVATRADGKVSTCLWGKLPPEARKVYETPSPGENSMTTGDPITDKMTTKTGAFYENEASLEATGKETGNTYRDNDKWRVLISRFPNPRNGDVNVIFRPTWTEGICQSGVGG